MTSLTLAEIFQNLGKGGSTPLRSPVLMGINLAKRQKRKVSDYIGSLITRNWEKEAGGYITTVDSVTLPQVLHIFYSSLDGSSDGLFGRYSKIFNHIFYVAQIRGDTVGYCVYYIKPSLFPRGIRKTAVIYSIAVDRDYQGQGIGKELLSVSIKEMKRNGIDEVLLYVDQKNSRAISLYAKFGFVAIGEIPNICGEGKNCYKMKLVLKRHSESRHT